nr:hypothetical protein [Actinomadura madurae]
MTQAPAARSSCSTARPVPARAASPWNCSTSSTAAGSTCRSTPSTRCATSVPSPATPSRPRSTARRRASTAPSPGWRRPGTTWFADYPLSRRWRLLDLLDLLVPDDSLLVGVRCPLPVLERREAERGDREPGLAARQFPEVHSHELHDLDVDTDTLSARQCAVQIREALEARPRPAAFTTLRDTLLRP